MPVINFVLSDLTQNEDVILLYLTVLQKVGDFSAFLSLSYVCFLFSSIYHNVDSCIIHVSFI